MSDSEETIRYSMEKDRGPPTPPPPGPPPPPPYQQLVQGKGGAGGAKKGIRGPLQLPHQEGAEEEDPHLLLHHLHLLQWEEIS